MHKFLQTLAGITCSNTAIAFERNTDPSILKVSLGIGQGADLQIAKFNLPLSTIESMPPEMADDALAAAFNKAFDDAKQQIREMKSNPPAPASPDVF